MKDKASSENIPNRKIRIPADIISRKHIVLCILLSLSLCVTACSSGIPKANSNGGLVTFKSADDLTATGFYTQDNDGFHPLYRVNASFSTSSSSKDILASRYLREYNEYQLVPVITKGSGYLVYVNSTADLTADVVLEKMKDNGYTLGVTFNDKAGSDFIGIGKAKTCAGSNATIVFKDLVSSDAYTFEGINDVALSKTMLDQNGLLVGLEQNARYKLSGYKGTAYKEFILKADTHYFVSSSFITIKNSNAFTLTKLGYAVVNLPSNLASGLYYVNGTGCFFYDADGTQSLAQPTVTQDKTSSSAPTDKKNIEDIITTQSIDKTDTDQQLDTAQVSPTPSPT